MIEPNRGLMPILRLQTQALGTLANVDGQACSVSGGAVAAGDGLAESVLPVKTGVGPVHVQTWACVRLNEQIERNHHRYQRALDPLRAVRRRCQILSWEGTRTQPCSEDGAEVCFEETGKRPRKD